jgi:hypothetical protein
LGGVFSIRRKTLSLVFVMPNPWDIPAPPARGDRKADSIFTAIGRGLTSWEIVEHDLAEMFAIFTGSPIGLDALANNPAMRAYGTIVSFRGRTDLPTAAANAYFQENRNPALGVGSNFF